MKKIVSHHEFKKVRVPIEENNPSIMLNPAARCTECGLCKKTCSDTMAVGKMFRLSQTGGRAVCVNCGQCMIACPFGTISERIDYPKVKELCANKAKTVVFSVAPAVRVGLGDAYKIGFGDNIEGRLIAALRKLGAKYVFDLCFAADLTIMEEGSELFARIKDATSRPPLFSSCCPAWVSFVEIFYPEFIPNLSTAKSPVAMQGSLIKSFFAQQKNLKPEDIVTVSVMPCTAKKFEIKRQRLNTSWAVHNNPDVRDNDFVITTKELVMWLQEENIDLQNLKNDKFDSLIESSSLTGSKDESSSGAGVLFGSSGGVMEAAVRTAYFLAEKKNLPADFLNFESLRGLDALKTAQLKLDSKTLRVASVSGLENMRLLLDEIKAGTVKFDFIEVMACPGGCINGAGQPKVPRAMQQKALETRQHNLYAKDAASRVRLSHENAGVAALYKTFLKKPLGELSHKLLHTGYINRKYSLYKMRLKKIADKM